MHSLNGLELTVSRKPVFTTEPGKPENIQYEKRIKDIEELEDEAEYAFHLGDEEETKSETKSTEDIETKVRNRNTMIAVILTVGLITFTCLMRIVYYRWKKKRLHLVGTQSFTFFHDKPAY